MQTITLLHEHYNGADGDKPFSLEQGASIDVSDEKAEQLARDFPDWFEIDGTTPPKDDKLDKAAVLAKLAELGVEVNDKAPLPTLRKKLAAALEQKPE